MCSFSFMSRSVTIMRKIELLRFWPSKITLLVSSSIAFWCDSTALVSFATWK